MIAKVILPLPLNSAFDYSVPLEFRKNISKGMRVKVSFRNRNMIGYVLGISAKSKFKALKPIMSLLDEVPIIDNDFFKLAEYISLNCFCSLGQAVDVILPVSLRKGRKIDSFPCKRSRLASDVKHEVILIQDLINKRWDIFKNSILNSIEQERGVIVLTPEIGSCLRIKELIKTHFKKEVVLLHSKNTAKEALGEWCRLKRGDVDIVVGTSSAIFAPVNNLGLVIIDQEDSAVYKQEQTPYYNVKDIALYRTKQNNATLFLASPSPALESYYSAKKGKYKFRILDNKKTKNPFVQIVDLSEEYYKQRKKSIVLSNILENGISKTLAEGGKVMLFLNRVGFATLPICKNCGFIIKCDRCSRQMIFLFDKKELLCRGCNSKIPVPNICPQCNLSYIKYLGLGTEKLESEVNRLFPQARIIRYDRLKNDIDLDKVSFDILITSQIILKDLYKLKGVNLLGVLSVDSSLNRIDFRSAEKVYQIISRMLLVTKDKAILQTHLPEHYIFKPLRDNDYALFYERELCLRRELFFPPFSWLALIKIRGRLQDKVVSQAEGLFQYLEGENRISVNRDDSSSSASNNPDVEIFNPAPDIPLKLRGNFRYNILLKASPRRKLVDFINKSLRGFKKSGVIITVDIDPL